MIFYIIFILGAAFTSKVLLHIIQPGQLLGFYTQKVVEPLFYSESPKKQALSKILGGCHTCFTFHFSWFIALFLWLPFSIHFEHLPILYYVPLFLFFPSFSLVIFSILKRIEL